MQVLAAGSDVINSSNKGIFDIVIEKSQATGSMKGVISSTPQEKVEENDQATGFILPRFQTLLNSGQK